MPVLTATNIRHAFGERIVLDAVNLTVENAERIGIVGRNGTGKSTLLRVLAGLTKPDSGDVALQKGRRVGYLHQDPDLDPRETLRGAAEGAFETLHRLHRDLDQLFEHMASAEGPELDRLLKRQTNLEKRIEAEGGYAIDHRIDSVLHGLGFTDAQFSVPVHALSGGQKARLALAKLLLQEPDVLLLDEPTNHLDIDGRLWLESFLADVYPGAVVLISHDRYLLDRVVTRIVEVEAARLIDYPGNYAAFRRLRAERRVAQLRAWENQQTKFRQEEQFIQKYKAGQRAKQARGRLSRLERAREGAIERPLEVSDVRLELPRGPRSGDLVVSARDLAKRYTLDTGKQKILFEHLDVSIERGERWGVVGPNGAGKTTLVRCLLGEQQPDEGEARVGSNVVVGYFEQLHEGIDPDTPLIRFIQNRVLKETPDKPLSEQQARNLAGAFLFSGDDQDKEMGVLSGGERARALLAALLHSGKNLLVLDEPTNHLDIPSAERLEDALRYDPHDKTGYDGAMILISHDRALIDATCDHLVVLDGQGGATTFAGNYSQWHEQREAERRLREHEQAEQRRQRDEHAKRERRAAEQQKQRDRKAAGPSPNALERLRTEQLEQRIEKIESRISEIDAQLADPDVWQDHQRSASLGDERAALASELEPLEFEWSRRAEA